MKKLGLTAVLTVSGLFTSYAVLLAENSVATKAPNPVPFRLDVTSISTMPAPLTNTTAAQRTTPAPLTNTTAARRTTPAPPTNTTAARRTTPAPPTNTTAARRTTPAPPTNTTAARRTTPAPPTNTTAARRTTPAPPTNTTAARRTTPTPPTNTTAARRTTPTPLTNTTAARLTTSAPPTNTTAARHTTPAPPTNTTAARHTTPAPLTNTTAANHTTMHPVTTVVPTLSPNFSLPLTGNYSVSLKNTTCIKMVIGIQLVVNIMPKNLHFNIQPKDVVTSGKCGNVTSWINLNFKVGFVNFTFGKTENEYFISEISVALHFMNHLDHNYKGILKNMKQFKTELRHSYKCKSKQVVAFSTDSLEILMVDTQLQAFSISGGIFSKEEECSMDYNCVLPIVFGIGLVALIIIITIICLIWRHKQAAGYQRI
ncbi:lysosome-associated membrane glycoprotein 3-like [Narcine bancroftii]|uniref:lysosome-associated membrane glycoprotein 3-like n=1 Tax=Narcine bancroftii TaxID=1343680 RepID=UPI0038310051